MLFEFFFCFNLKNYFIKIFLLTNIYFNCFRFHELSPEEREAKLLRHFEKLSDEKKKIFEELALND